MLGRLGDALTSGHVEDPPLEDVIAEMFTRADLEANGKLGHVPELLNEE